MLDIKLVEQVVQQLTELAPKQSGFGPAATNDRHILFAQPYTRLPVKVKTGTKGAKWSDEEFGERLTTVLRGASAAQWQESLMKFVREEVDKPWNDSFGTVPAFGSGAARSPFGRA